MQHFRDRLWMVAGTFAAIAVVVLTLAVSIRGAEAQGGAAVSIVDFAFEPATLEIPAGTTVTWTNNGRVPHTVSDSGAFNSGLMAPGATFSLTFDTAGSYPYFCKIHPQVMTGTIVVTGAAAPAPEPEATQAEAPELAGVGVGTMAPAQGGGLALLAAMAAAIFAAAALITWRRA